MQKTPLVHIVTLLAFLANMFGPSSATRAEEFVLPKPGVMVQLSPKFTPPGLKGLKVNPNNPFTFDFILDKGDSQLNNDQIKDESTKLIKYFLASLTVPENDLWVNLSPYEKNRVIPDSFGLTEMGRDLLAEDYMLKQITASLIYPEGEFGKKFWKRVYEQAAKQYGVTDMPVNTFNKVWIVPDKAIVYENAKIGTAYVVESKLKVMLEQDYLALEKNTAKDIKLDKSTSALGSQIVREIVIPELTKEVNEGQNFARLRQVYQSLILATWYKKKNKDSVLAQVYQGKNKVAGININDPQEKEKIYQQYLQAFKKGVYNYIKEDVNPLTQETIPRKYFSGGLTMNAEAMDAAMTIVHNVPTLSNSDNALLVQAGINVANSRPKITQPDKAMVGEWQEGRENGLVYRFGWEKKLTPTEAQEQIRRMDALPQNQPIDRKIFSSTEIFDVTFIMSTGGVDASKNGEAIYDFYVRPGMRTSADVSPFYKGFVKLILKRGKLDRWEGMDISSKRMEDFPWLQGYLTERLNELKGTSFADSAMTSIEEALARIDFDDRQIRDLTKRIRNNKSPKLLRDALTNLLSMHYVGSFAEYGYEYEQRMIRGILQANDPLKQIELLSQPEVMSEVSELARRLEGNEEESGGLFDSIVKSANVSTKVVRAVKTIDALDHLDIEGESYWKIVRALNKVDIKIDVEESLRQISERLEGLTGQAKESVVNQVTQALEKGRLADEKDAKRMVKATLIDLLSEKKIEANTTDQIKTWADKKTINGDVLIVVTRVIEQSPYLDKKNAGLFLSKLSKMEIEEAKIFLSSMERLSERLNAFNFNEEDALRSAKAIVEQILSDENTVVLSSKLSDLLSTRGVGYFSEDNDYYEYERRMVRDVFQLENPVKQIERIMQPEVIDNITELVRRLEGNEDEAGNIFDSIVKSANVGIKAARAVKTIDVLYDLNIEGESFWKIVKALNRVEIAVDVEGALNTITEKVENLAGQSKENVIQKMVASLERGELPTSGDTKGILKAALIDSLKSKGVEKGLISQVRAWASKSIINDDVLIATNRILEQSSYLDKRNTALFFNNLINASPDETKIFLDAIERLSQRMNQLGFAEEDTLRSGKATIERILVRQDAINLCSKLAELLSVRGVGYFSEDNEYYQYERQMVRDLLQVENPIKQIERLMQAGVIEEIAELVRRLESNEDEAGGIFDYVIKSASVDKKAARAVKAIDMLNELDIEDNVLWKIVKVLNKLETNIDVETALGSISEQISGLSGQARENVVRQLAQKLGKGELPVSAKRMLRTALVDLLAEKGFEGKVVSKVKAWTDKNSINNDLLIIAARVIEDSVYLDKKNTNLFLSKLVALDAESAKTFLDGIERLSQRMNNLGFNEEDTTRSGRDVIGKVLSSKDSINLSSKLADFVSKELNFSDDDGYEYERRMVKDILQVDDPVSHIARLVQPGVMNEVADLARRIQGEEEGMAGVFDSIVKSANVEIRAARAVKVIDALSNIEELEDDIRARAVKMLTSTYWGGDNVSTLVEALTADKEEQSKIQIPWKQLWEKARSLEEQKVLLGIVVYLVKFKREFTYSFAFLKSQIDSIYRVPVQPGQERILSPLEEEIIKAVNNTDEKDILLAFLLRKDLPLEFREVLLKDLEGYVLDGGIHEVYEAAKRNKNVGANKFWDIFYEFHQKFQMCPPSIMMKYFFNEKITFDDLERLRPKVIGLDFHKLLEVFASEGKREDKLLLTYFIFNQPKLSYGHAFTFSLFKQVVEKSLWFAKAAQTDRKAKNGLRNIIRRSAPEAEEIIQAMDEGRVILPKSSGMIDQNGDFIPQAVNVTFEDSTAMEDARENFVTEYNRHFNALLEILYLARSIKGILDHYDDQPLKDKLARIIDSIKNTSDISDRTLASLRSLHVQTMKLLPKFA